MSALKHDFALGKQQLPIGGQILALRWATIADAGNVVAVLAELTDDSAQLPINASLHSLTGWRGEMLEREMAQLSVLLETGLAGLLGVKQGGGDVAPAARALFAEYVESRATILQLLARN